MKQTNNALTFLKSQYKAILQNAYIKGISSALLCSIMAYTPIANATIFNETITTAYKPTNSDTIYIDGSSGTASATNPHYEFLYIDNNNSTGTSTVYEDFREYNFEISAGELNTIDYNIRAYGNPSSFNMRDLTIKNGAHLKITSTATQENIAHGVGVQARNFYLESGKLKFESEHNVVFFSADEMILGSAVAAESASITMGQHSYIGKPQINSMPENPVKKLVLNQNSSIISTKNKNVSVKTKELNINGGEFDISKPNAALNLSLNHGYMNNGAIKIGAGNTLNLSFFKYLDLKNDREFNLNKGSLDIHGTLNISSEQDVSAILSLTDDVAINADISAPGTVNVSGSNMTLVTSKQTLDNLMSKTKFTLTDSRLYLDDEYVVMLGKNNNIPIANSAQLNSIYVDTSATIKANNMIVDGSVASGSLLNIEAEYLSLKGASHGLQGMSAKNITFGSASTPYTLTEDLTLSSIKKSDGSADVGTITNDVTISGGTLAVNGGAYSAKDTIKLDSGTLTIGDAKVKTSSDVTLADLSLDNTHGANSITIVGSKDAQSSLNITDASQLTLVGSTSNGTTIEVKEHASLNIAGEKLNTFLDSKKWTGTTTSGGAIYVNGGTVNTADATLDAAMFGAAADASNANYNIVFNTTSGGKLLTNNLTLTDTTGNGLAFNHANGKSMVRVTDTLNISAKDTSGSHAIKQGNFFVGKEIKSDNRSSLSIGESGATSAVLTLGELTVANNFVSHSADSGCIGVDLAIAGQNNTNKSQLAINYGTWTGKSISGTNADIALGFDLSQNATVAKYDHKWGLDIEKLDLGNNSTFAVYQNTDNSTITTELVVDELSVDAGSQITLFGDMIVNGKSGSNNNGINLDANAINVDSTGHFTITGAALENISISGDNVSVSGFTKGSILTNPGSVIKLDFDSSIGTLSANTIKALKSSLFVTDSSGFIKGTINLGQAQIAGLETDNNGKISWDKIDPQKDVVSDVTNNDLQHAKVTDVDDQDKVRGSYGSISSKTINSANGGQINTDGVLTLSEAHSNNGYFAAQYHLPGGNGQFLGALGFNVDAKASLILKNGGKANKVTLDVSSDLIIDGHGNKTELTSVDGGSGSKVTVSSGALEVINDQHNATFAVGSLNTQALSSVKLDSLAINDDTSISAIAGDLEVSGASTFAGQAILSGKNQLADVSFSKDASITGNKTVAKNVTFAEDLYVYRDSSLSAQVLKATNGKRILVGKSASIDSDGSLNHGSNGSISVGRLDLQKASIVADPDFSKAASFVGADAYGDKDVTDGSAGEVNGKIYALQNSIISIGNKDEVAVKETFRKLIEADGSLQNTSSDLYGVGAIAYVAKNVSLANDSQLIVDQKNTDKSYLAQSYSGSLVIGENSVLAIDAKALSESNKAAILFNQDAASINVANEVSSKILLTGDIASIQDKDLKLFSTNKPASGVTLNVTVGNSISIESLSGLYSSKLNAGKLPETVKLSFQLGKAQEKFASITGTMKDTLIAAARGYLDYEDPNPTDKVLGELTSAYKTADGTTFTKADGSSVTINDPYYNKLEAVKQSDGYFVVYKKPDNKLINHIVVNNGAPIDAETSMNLAVFGGAPQVALQAGAAAYDTISSRMGIGLSTVRYAGNGQGKTLWVNQIYKNAEYDGLAIENQTYGTDIKLYGMTIGADYELQPNLTVGAMFSAGSGDVSGTNLAYNVSNDFNYYGLGFYAGYDMDNLSFAGFKIDNLSFIADLSYTMVDNDLEGKTGVGTLKSSADSSNLSLGVTGKADFKIAQYYVTPHAGVRLSLLELDDFGTEYSQSSVDSLNIFSVPVGVTIAREIEHSGWLLKPSVDVTLTGNFGDTEVKTDTKWTTYSNLKTSTKSEVLDDFSYGATVGLSASSGNMFFGGGINYTTSSSMDEFGLNANASYKF